MHRVHRHPIPKRNSPPSQASQSPPASSPAVVISTGQDQSTSPTITDAEVEAQEEARTDLDPRLHGYHIQILGQTVRFFFPIPLHIVCPVLCCDHSFRTVKWHTTCSSAKWHLTTFHKIPNLKTEYWYSVCSRRIHGLPAIHPCLKDSLILTDQVTPASAGLVGLQLLCCIQDGPQ
ncbi:hypothetical protein TNIN_198411 [Trichonephila inaurata madagascariensis]|uniref:Uncharacterized protein n=1 Tax=Trichonephila inaurata madagascariensis TaxID=2747483 RepID=A0A8X6MFF7_9ARAC|nr:hypothetical protein TNIN_198411 [Trichonephila inaurata madagascariensis]